MEKKLVVSKTWKKIRKVEKFQNLDFLNHGLSIQYLYSVPK